MRFLCQARKADKQVALPMSGGPISSAPCTSWATPGPKTPMIVSGSPRALLHGKPWDNGGMPTGVSSMDQGSTTGIWGCIKTLNYGKPCNCKSGSRPLTPSTTLSSVAQTGTLTTACSGKSLARLLLASCKSPPKYPSDRRPAVHRT
jgi:hypothetical protein